MIIIFIGIVIIGALGYWWYTNSMQDTNTPAVDTQQAAAASATETKPAAEPQTLEGGLIIQDTVVGTGDEAVAGKMLSMHYTGTLDNGTVFDSSVPRGQAFEFTLGAGQVIPGWEKGIAGMKVGGKRTLTIPPPMAYGEQGIGPIPPNSTLHFDVELLGVK